LLPGYVAVHHVGKGSRAVHDGCTAEHIPNIAWAFALVNWTNALLFTALAKTAKQSLSDFTVHKLANIA